MDSIWKPKRWLATLLSLLLGYLGMLYVGKAKWFWVYLLASITLIFIAHLIFEDIPIFDLANLISLILSIVCAIHTFNLCSNFDSKSPRPWYSYGTSLVGIILMIAIPVVIIRAFFYEPYHLPSMAMSPNFNKGDYIIVSKFGYGNYGTYGIQLMNKTPFKKIQRGDVIVFSYPKDKRIDYIKRVIGLPNDKITYINKKLSINGKPLLLETLPAEYEDEDLIKETIENASWLVINTLSISPKNFEFTVPPRSYFVMGDNRDNSSDSRYWGTVPDENIKGKVIYTFEGLD